MIRRPRKCDPTSRPWQPAPRSAAGHRTRQRESDRQAWHPAMLTASGSSAVGLNHLLNIEMCLTRALVRAVAQSPRELDDIVPDREKFAKNRRTCRETGHSSRRDGSRQHDDHRRRARHPPRSGKADWLVDSDGNGSSRQAHGWPLAAHQGLRSARLARRRGVRRLGHFRRQRVRGRQDGRRARVGAARSGPSRAREDPPDASGVRSPVREAPGRPQCEEGREQARHGRPAPRGHAPVQSRNTASIGS